jgi:PAS domain S-box-containing protein
MWPGMYGTPARSAIVPGGKATSTISPASQQLSVLLISDGDNDARLLQHALETTRGAQHGVTHTVGLDGARGALTEGQYDIVLLDLELPDSKGLDTLVGVQELAPHVPIIVLTGHDSEDKAIEAAQAGAQDYIVKGAVDGNLVAKAIRYAIERKRAENALRDSEERYRAVVEQASEAIFLLDPDTMSFLEANRAFQKLLGYGPEELNDLTLYDVLPYPRERVDSATRRVLEQGHYPTVERLYRHKDGTLIDVELTITRIKYGGRHVLSQVLHDITGRKRAEAEREEMLKQLASERALLEAVLQQLPSGVIIAEAPSGKLLMGNDRTVEMWRHPFIASSEIEGYVAYAGYHADGRLYAPEDWPLARSVTAGEVTLNEEIRVLRGDGTRGVLNVSSAPVRNINGEIVAGVVIFDDVTERANDKEQLETQKALLEATLDASPMGLMYLDKDMRVIRMNAAYGRLIHLDPTTTVGQSFYDLVPEALFRQEAHRSALAGESVELHDVEYVDPVDKLKHYRDIYYRPMTTGEGDIAGLVVAMLDVTERRELERRKEEFLSVASHELRTPVTSVKGYADLALRSATQLRHEKLIRSLTVISSQANHLTRLINDLLDVSRMESGALPLHRQPFNLCELLRESAQNLDLMSPGFEWHFDMPESSAIVDADRHLISEVVTNLMTNAIKYALDVYRIEVSVTCGEAEVVTAIRDYGVGIPTDQQERVFDRFFRAMNAGAHTRSGLGLGLYISRSLVERHGGRIWLESVQGKGSTFYFSLPLQN